MSLSKLGIFILLICALGLGGFIVVQMTHQKSDSSVSESAPEVPPTKSTYQEEPLPAPTEKKIPFANFITQGGSYECSVQQLIGDMESKGIVYIHEGMIRGVFTTATQGMVIDSSLIVRDGYTYTWSPLMQGKGVRVPVTTTTDTPTDASVSAKGEYSFNAERIGDYHCEPWVPDMAQFELPQGIVFSPLITN